MNDNQNNLNNDVMKTDYYNNNSYYSNNNYNDNYSDTTYEEKEKKNGVWWKILLLILVLVIIIFLLLKFCGNDKKSQDEKYTELLSRICVAAENYVMNNPSVLDRTVPGKSKIIKLKSLVDSNLIETQIENPYYTGGLFKKSTVQKYYSLDMGIRLTVTANATLNCEMVDNANDVTAPELRLNGDAEITLAVGTEFEDPGYTATDDYDGDVTDKVQRSGNVDNTKAGEYELRYTVQDSAGNVAEKTRKIIFEEFNDIEVTMGSILDGVTPMISLKGANPYCMVKGTKFVEPGATATDNVDGNITNKIAVTNKVTGNIIGSFRVVYKVEDSSGNEATAYRAVIVSTSCPNNNDEHSVAANSRPTITLVGKSSVTIARGTEYIDLGATAYDKEDGDITHKIVTDTTQVNVNAAGSYKVHYRVTDTAQQTTTATRTVIVKDNVSGNPSVRFTEDKENIDILVTKGNDDLLAAPKAVNENGVQVVVTTEIEDFVTKEKVNSIDWNKLGKYRVIYTAIHGNGVIKQTKTMVVTIIEDSVTIGGSDTINVSKRTENCNITEADLVAGGVTFTTLGDATPIVSIDAKENIACEIGTYKITVRAKVTTGPEVSKEITVFVANGEGGNAALDAPSKVRIVGNSAFPNDPYNTTGLWVGGTVTGITIAFETTPKENTEIGHFEYSMDCSKPTDKISKLSSNSGTLTLTNVGRNNVCIRAITTSGVVSEWSDPVNVYIDRTGPSVEFTHTWNDEKSDWHNKDSLELTYSAKDTESGLSHFEYTYDDVKAKKAEEIVTYDEATGKLIVNENTEPSRPELFVYVRAVDKAGNKGEWTLKPAYANMDTVKPNAPTLSVVGNNTSLVKINATFEDGQSIRPSGFGKFIYTLNDGDELSETTSTITLPTNKTTSNLAQYVKVWSMDKAGNRSDNFSSENVIVTPGKVATGVELKNNGKVISNGASCSPSEVNIGNTFTLTATPIPADSDDKNVTWSISDASIAVIDENGKVTVNKVGETTITAKLGELTTSCKLTVKASSNSAPIDYYYDPCNGPCSSTEPEPEPDNKVVSKKIQVLTNDGAVENATSITDAYSIAVETNETAKDVDKVISPGFLSDVTTTSSSKIVIAETDSSGKTVTKPYADVTTVTNSKGTTIKKDVYSATTGDIGTTTTTTKTAGGTTKVTTTSKVTGVTQTVFEDKNGNKTYSGSSGGSNIKVGSLDWYLMYG